MIEKLSANTKEGSISREVSIIFFFLKNAPLFLREMHCCDFLFGKIYEDLDCISYILGKQVGLFWRSIL